MVLSPKEGLCGAGATSCCSRGERRERSRSKAQSLRWGCSSQAAHPQSCVFISVPKLLLCQTMPGSRVGLGVQVPQGHKASASLLPSPPNGRGPLADAGPNQGRLGICKVGGERAWDRLTREPSGLECLEEWDRVVTELQEGQAEGWKHLRCGPAPACPASAPLTPGWRPGLQTFSAPSWPPGGTAALWPRPPTQHSRSKHPKLLLVL